MGADEYSRWMRRCEELARQAHDRGDASIGAVVVRAGVVIAEGAEQVESSGDVAAHAELVAVRRASRALGHRDLSDCALVTTVEPCWMCSYAIRETRVGTVVIGSPVPDVGGVTSGHPILTDDGPAGWSPPPSIVWIGRGE